MDSSSRVRRRGFTPFRIPAPRDKKQCISRKEFKDDLSLELKRDYARVFRIPDADRVDEEDLVKLFCEYNGRLPLLPIHVRRGSVIDRRSSYKKTLKRILSLEDPDLDGPWNPKVSAIPERLIPAPDPVSRPRRSQRLKKAPNPEPAWTPPSRIEHELVYPPRAPVVGRDRKTGRDIVQPLSEDWLHVMLDEQEARYEALKLELQVAVSAVKDAVSEVTMMKAVFEDEEAKFEGFLDEIGDICGPETVDYIREQAEFGATNGFIIHGGLLQEDDDDSEGEGEHDDDGEEGEGECDDNGGGEGEGDDNGEGEGDGYRDVHNDDDNGGDGGSSDDSNEDNEDEANYKPETKAKQVDIAPNMRDQSKSASLRAKTPEPEPEPEPEAPNPPTSEDLTSLLVEASVPAEPPEAKSSPLAGFVYRLAERIFPKRRREEEDDDEKISADDNASDTEREIRPRRKRRCSPNEPIAQPPPPLPLPPSADAEGPRFFIDGATGSVTLNNAHPDNIKREKLLKKEAARAGLRRSTRINMAVEERFGIPKGDIVQLGR